MPGCWAHGPHRVECEARQVGELNAPEIMRGYRSASPVHEPKLGDVLRLPDRSGLWRVVDWTLADRVTATRNVLVVESIADQAA